MKDSQLGDGHINVLQRVLCFAYAATIPYDIVATVGPFSITVVAGVLLIVALLPTVVSEQNKSVGFDGMSLTILYVLVTWTLITCTWATAPSVALLSWGGLCQNVVICVILSSILDEVRQLMLWGLAISAFFMSSTITLTNSGVFYQRAQFMGADENITAYVLTAALAACLILMRRARPSVALSLLTLAGIDVIAIILTASRTGLAAVLLLIVAAFILREVESRGFGARVYLAAGVFLAGVILMQVRGAGLLPSRLQDFSQVDFAGDLDRQHILGLYFAHFDSWWLTGVGQGSDAFYLQRVAGVYSSAHGLVWKTWVEIGLVGLLLYLALLSRTVVCAALVKTHNRSAVVLLAVPLLTFAFSLGGESTATFWFIVAFSLSALAPKRIHPRYVLARNASFPVEVAGYQSPKPSTAEGTSTNDRP